jgi:hypothetical protein
VSADSLKGVIVRAGEIGPISEQLVSRKRDKECYVDQLSTDYRSRHFIHVAARYSERNATVGSTFVARSAGIYEARSDEASKISGAVTSTTGSKPSTPYKTP